MLNLPFTTLKFLHNNFSCFVTNNDNKYEILDSNRVPYIAKYNKESFNFLSVADENGYIKLFKTHPKLTMIKEFVAQKSCIYDLEWLNSNTLACGGGDQFISVYDINTQQRLAVLRGHTESVKSITSIPDNQFVIASGSRDGSILIFDIRCNKYQPTAEIVAELNIEADSCCIRSINSLNKAHFTENISSTSVHTRSVLKSRHSNLNSPSSPSSNIHHHNQNSHHYQSHHLNSNFKKSTPVSCVAYQNTHLLVSAGVTDGLIKIWDTRKIYTNTSKKSCDPVPLYIFDNQIKNSSSLSTPSSNHNSKKGYSSLIFNNSRSHLYSNCMNNFIYELNLNTYNPNHTRIINQPLANTAVKNYHLNVSNFIKSSISQCNNFILTGSSDFNAYIYTTNINNNLTCFKRFMPVIVLKGHTNEVTTVDWNPFDSNQLVTCSDDNTIRLWNVKRELDLIETKECNFLKAETIDEFKNEENSNLSRDIDEQEYESLEKLNENYITGIEFNNRIYNKYRPHSTGVFDDYLFVGFEHKKFLRKAKTIRNKIDFDDFDIEKELCIKCESINIDKVNTESISPTSCMLNSIDEDFIRTTSMETNYNIQNGFKKLKSILSDLPIYTFTEEKNEKVKEEISPSIKQQNNNNLLMSVFSFLSQSQNKPKVVRRRINKQRKSQDSNDEASSSQTSLSKTPITSKKRNINATLKDEISDLNVDNNLKTPKTKKRLIMSDLDTQQTVNLNQVKPSVSSAIGTQASTSNKTILDFFKRQNTK